MENNNKNYYRNKNRKHNHQNNLQQNQKKETDSKYQKISLDTPVCIKCGQTITDLTSALADKTSEQPIHFDCVLDILKETEKLEKNEKITYIGQGRFAVAYFENPHDYRHFTIRRIIEWEQKDKIYPWRKNIADIFSTVK